MISMKILGLYNNNCALELFQWLIDEGHEVILHQEKLNPAWCSVQNFSLTVSYTYRYILTQEIIDALNNNVVNIHNSLLPYNRGADPNLWSIAEQTPRGVTLHYIDARLDKGFIISQEILPYEDNDTLSTSYNNLDKAAKSMFKRAFKYYEFWPSMKKKALGAGTYHSLKDGAAMKSVITSYDLTIPEFIELLSRNTLRGGGGKLCSLLKAS